MSDEILLEIRGQLHGGWTEVSITRSIEAAAGNFNIGYTERWPGQKRPEAIAPGDSCRVSLGGVALVSGHVDTVEPSYDADSHHLAVRGRDAAADLVDCSAEHKPGAWIGQTLTRICAELAKPFKVPVTAEVDVGKPFKGFAVTNGETAFEAIERACRQRAVLPMSDGAGGLLLTRAGLGPSAGRLRRGETILAASGTWSVGDRYSSYTVKSQTPGDDNRSGKAAAEPVATVEDTTVKRHRPLILVAEAPGDVAALKQRAQWEASIRAGRARRAEVTLQGWRNAAGVLWRPNHTVHLTDDWLGTDHEMLIVSCRFTLGLSGRRTNLSLAMATAYQAKPLTQTADQEPGK